MGEMALSITLSGKQIVGRVRARTEDLNTALRTHCVHIGSMELLRCTARVQTSYTEQVQNFILAH